jgi:ubiquinone/menaquinone biosynthesis C-methylase UbiE
VTQRGEGSCCGPAPVADRTYASKIYSTDELAKLPDTVVEMSMGCGNPTAIAALRPGETVLDLGSGGGIDVFLAAAKVGANGYVIGVDMTPEMIDLARQNAQKLGVTNVEFRQGVIEELPVEGNTVDVIISNCVINLSPDKDAVFGEAFRVLKPGGRLAVSDIVLQSEPPAEIRASMESWSRCVAGALLEDDYLAKIRAAGFRSVSVDAKNVFSSSSYAEEFQLTPELRAYLDAQVASIRVTAIKP